MAGSPASVAAPDVDRPVAWPRLALVVGGLSAAVVSAGMQDAVDLDVVPRELLSAVQQPLEPAAKRSDGFARPDPAPLVSLPHDIHG